MASSRRSNSSLPRALTFSIGNPCRELPILEGGEADLDDLGHRDDEPAVRRGDRQEGQVRGAGEARPVAQAEHGRRGSFFLATVSFFSAGFLSPAPSCSRPSSGFFSFSAAALAASSGGAGAAFAWPGASSFFFSASLAGSDSALPASFFLEFQDLEQSLFLVFLLGVLGVRGSRDAEHQVHRTAIAPTFPRDG